MNRKTVTAIAVLAAAFGLTPSVYADDADTGLYDASASGTESTPVDEATARQREKELAEFREQIYRDMLHE